MSQIYQVIIVGGGPVGVGLAVELGQRGTRCALVERRLTPQRIPKGQNLTQRTLEHFYFWNCVDEIRAARIMPAEVPTSGVNIYGDLTSDFWSAPAQRELVQQYYFQAYDRLPQYCVEAVLRQRLAALPSVTALFGWTAQAITQDGNSACVTIAAEDGTQQVLAAEYVVGCDGGHSLVREAASIRRSGAEFDQKMVLMVFHSKQLQERLKRFPLKSTYNIMHPDLKGYWRFFGRVDMVDHFFFHAPVPIDAGDRPEDFLDVLFRAAGFEFDVTLEHAGFWDLRVAVAQTYRAGRLFIAGDAAHSHPPYGGFGLNNGLEDAANLGWKLAARLDGWGGEGLLDAYTLERRPVFADIGRDFIAARIEEDRAFLERYSPQKDYAEFEQAWKARMARVSGRAQVYEPHYEGSPVIAGPPGGVCSAHGEHTFTARAGHHLPPAQLSSGRNVFEELGEGFTLLAFGADAQAVQEVETAAQALKLPLKIVRDHYDGGREIYQSRLILVRPDQYVAWCGDAADHDTAALLRKVTGLSINK